MSVCEVAMGTQKRSFTPPARTHYTDTDASVMYSVWGTTYLWSKWSLICKVGMKRGKYESFLKHTHTQTHTHKTLMTWVLWVYEKRFFLIFIDIQLQLYAFYPHPSTPPQLNPPPSPTFTLPIDFVHVLYSSSCNPLFPLSPPHCPLAIVRWFLTSLSLVIFCLLFSSIAYVPVKCEIIWYLSYSRFLTHRRSLPNQKLSLE